MDDLNYLIEKRLVLVSLTIRCFLYQFPLLYLHLPKRWFQVYDEPDALRVPVVFKLFHETWMRNRYGIAPDSELDLAETFIRSFSSKRVAPCLLQFELV